MLYVSTRNKKDTFTAYRALHEDCAPDGGCYVPFHLPEFSAEDLAAFKSQSVSETISQILNLFFGLHLSGLEVECVIGKAPFGFETLNQNVLIAEAWHTPEGDWKYVLKSLYRIMADKGKIPAGWTYIAAEIVLLFGMYSAIDEKFKTFDFATTVDDFAGLTAIMYAKEMGLPVNLIICACNESGIVWDLINKGEFSTNLVSDYPHYMEFFLYKCFENQGVLQYLDVSNRKGVYHIHEASRQYLNDNLYPAVVSSDRAETVISSMYRTNQYSIDHKTALAYGGLQDYRASVGINKNTVILAKNRPERIKE